MSDTLELPRLEDFSDPAFDAFAAERASRGDYPDPYPLIEQLRQQGAVHHVQYRSLFTDRPDAQVGHMDHWTVFGYDACNQILMDHENFTNWEAFQHNLGVSFGRTITCMDGAEHARFRKVLQKALLPNVVSKWGDSLVAPVMDKLLGKFIGQGHADLVEDYTHHFPFQIVYAMLHIGDDQAAVFHKLAVAQLLSAAGLPQGAEATRKLGDFFKVYLQKVRANPSDDLMSYLSTVEVDGERLEDEVLIAFMRQLLNAGGDTTYRATSVLLTCLLKEPGLYQQVQEDRSLLGSAIEEALRWDGPVTSTFRFCKNATSVQGTIIPAGAMVNVCLGSANRDPGKYENPDRFDIFRKRTVRHLAFAGGPHLCVGQHLARVEMHRAMGAILDNLHNLRLDPDRPAPVIIGHLLRAPDHIHVKFDPA
ncbi:cytochrome P450 [Novosphingobium sp.]|jgi:cytochrome P450|uniref:cytochrome P450 n=1 Tax=Novosphingobium sp. TaxID=1874826 RepID=UPI001EC2C05B|nr:cytochrome P450 [Novosphingobium sp.]MBK9012016.1 cytochrome P450 [Novosphingobium sp.]